MLACIRMEEFGGFDISLAPRGFESESSAAASSGGSGRDEHYMRE